MMRYPGGHPGVTIPDRQTTRSFVEDLQRKYLLSIDVKMPI